MNPVKIIEVKESVLAGNDREADQVRAQLKKDRTFLVNLMSSPGSGKTTTLLKTIELLKNDVKLGVMEADIDSDVDAATIEKTGAKVIQLHTGGMCHLDAGMTRQGLPAFGTEGLDLVVLENVGNLVCPAEFDTGAVQKRDDPLRARGARQAPQVPADVLHLRRAAHQQDRRHAVFRL
jgi:hydrogenase nickel incorporation protein HypB